jgi:drug/metabolite transporter (DMT)-like permease
MVVTSIISILYMWHQKIPNFLIGPKEVRMLLVLRGALGFFGVFGLYYSLAYLTLSEAVVITFLVPACASWLCSVLIHEPFPFAEKICGAISLGGVILIANPFNTSNEVPTAASPDGAVASFTNATIAAVATGTASAAASAAEAVVVVTTSQRLIAVAVALFGVVGAAFAFTFIRWIGNRAHALVTVNAFALWCVFVSTIALVFFPHLTGGFKMPQGIAQWAMLTSLGLAGFIMQFLLTAGLQAEKSSRASNMLYTQMLFATVLDKVVWGVTPNTASIIGGGLILGSAIFIASRKGAVAPPRTKEEAIEVEEGIGLEEAEGLLSSDEEDGGAEEEEAERGRSRVRA